MLQTTGKQFNLEIREVLEYPYAALEEKLLRRHYCVSEVADNQLTNPVLKCMYKSTRFKCLNVVCTDYCSKLPVTFSA